MPARRGLISTGAFAALALWGPARAQPVDLSADVSLRGSVEVAYAANGLVSCDSLEADCRGVRSAIVSRQNTDLEMRFIDVDPPPLGDLDADGRDDTINSSGATLELPEGARVEFARLYVGGIWRVDNADLCGPPRQVEPDDRLSVRMAPPGSDDYVSLRGELLGEDRQAVGSGYAAAFDVTEHVTTSGDVWVADAALVEGRCAAGGWALAVVYRTDDGPARSVTLMSGYAVVGDTVVARAVADELLAPPTSVPEVTIAVGAVEGDRGLDADRARLDGLPLSDGFNPADDLFNSTVSRGGRNADARTPSHVNNLGYDFDVLDATGLLPADAREAVVEIAAERDVVKAFFVGVSVDLAVPELAFGQEVRALAGNPAGPVESGDRVRFTLELAADPTNNDTIAQAVIDDPLPIEAAWVDGTVEVQRGEGPFVPIAETAGSATYDRETHSLEARVGAPLAPGERWRLRFDVDVLPSARRVIENSPTVRWWGASAGPGVMRRARSDSDPEAAGEQPASIAVAAAPDMGPELDGGVDSAAPDAAIADASPPDLDPIDVGVIDSTPGDLAPLADAGADAADADGGLLADGEELSGGFIFGCSATPGTPAPGWLLWLLALGAVGRVRRRPAGSTPLPHRPRRRDPHAGLRALALALPLLAPEVANAGERFDLQGFAAASDLRHHGLRLLSARPRSGPRWSTGLLLDHADDPLVVEADGERTRSLVSRQTRAHLVTNAAFTETVDLGFVVPVMLDAAGDGAVGGPGVGDMRVQGRVVVWQPEAHPQTVGAVAVDLFLGTGDGDAFHGDAGLRFETRALVAHRLEGGIDLRGNLGWHARDPARLGNLEVDDALTFGVGAEIPLTATWALLPEIDGAIGVVDDLDASEVPLEALVAARWTPHPAWSAIGGLGGGLAPGAGTPDWRIVLGFEYTRVLPAADGPATETQPPPARRWRQPSSASRFSASSGSR